MPSDLPRRSSKNVPPLTTGLTTAPRARPGKNRSSSGKTNGVLRRNEVCVRCGRGIKSPVQRDAVPGRADPGPTRLFLIRQQGANDSVVTPALFHIVRNRGKYANEAVDRRLKWRDYFGQSS